MTLTLFMHVNDELICYVHAQAAGQTVDVKGHTVTLKPGKCNPLMMGGKPYMSADPKDMHTSNNNVVHWDGKVWSI